MSKKLCDGCCNERRKVKWEIGWHGKRLVFCDKCKKDIIALNVKSAAQVMYDALKAAVEHGAHDQDCDQFGFEPDPDDICNCWYGRAADALVEAEGKVKELS